MDVSLNVWFSLILFLSIFLPVDTLDYENAAKKLLSEFKAGIDTPISKDVGKLGRFKEKLNEFTKTIVPLAEYLAESKNETTGDIGKISNLTKTIFQLRHRLITHDMHDVSTELRYFLTDYQKTVSFNLNSILRYLLIKWTYGGTDDYELHVCIRDSETISHAIENMVGSNCLNRTFSPRAASIIFELIDSFEYADYALTRDEKNWFKPLFVELYDFFDEKKHFNISHYSIQMFLRDRKGFVYKNKVKLLEDLVQLFNIRYDYNMQRDCLPFSAFIFEQFDNGVWLRIGDAVIHDIYVLKYLTFMCANMTHYGDPEGASRFVAVSEKILQPVYSVLTGWFESLMESTWPTTETELIRGFMKEASGGQPIPHTVSEFQRVVTFVHDKMKSIGHPGYTRHFVLTKEYSDSTDKKDFEMKCKMNACSRVVSVGAQCVILRADKVKTQDKMFTQQFVNFTEELKPKLLEAMEIGNNKNLLYASSVADELYSEHGVPLTVFSNHSNYMMLHHSEYGSKCSVLYEYKSDDGELTPSLQSIRYHNDGGMFSNCHDWLFFLGI